MMQTSPTIHSVSQPTIEALALCVFRRNQDLLLSPVPGIQGNHPCFRPLGGPLQVGEYSWEAVRRQMRSTLGEEVENLTFIGPSEQVTLGEGNTPTKHEIIFLFQAEFTNADLYLVPGLRSVDSHGQPFEARWMPISDFKRSRARLCPEGLLDLLLG